jgi:hypothetical protein
MSYKEVAKRVNNFEDWLFDQPSIISGFIMLPLVMVMLVVMLALFFFTFWVASVMWGVFVG